MTPEETYRDRSEAFASERDRLDGLLTRLANARMALFLASVICLLGVWDVTGTLRWLLLLVAFLLLTTFFVFVRASKERKAQRRLQEQLRQVNEYSTMRFRRQWTDLPESEQTAPVNHAYAADLDLFGHASLSQLLGTATTIPGKHTLSDWLLSPAGHKEILERQAAVAELAPQLDYRQHVEAHGRMIGQERPHALHAFLDWIPQASWIMNRPRLVWSARLLPVVTILSLILHVSGLFSVPIWALTIGIGTVISVNTYSRVHTVFSLVSSGDVGLRRYAPVFEAAMAKSLEAPRLVQLQQRMAYAAGELRRLDRFLAYTEVRHSGMLHGLLQVLLMWDHNVLGVLEHWASSAGRSVQGWINALGELEALGALAALAHAHPDWSFPDIIPDDAPPTVQCKGLGHPLLSTERCVVNDVKIGPPGSFLFVTGSNMSGKSTLLRSVGVNAVLAQAGGPVFAAMMRLPRVTVFTSMRVSDSLEQGISQYMAQLNRLKALLDGARFAAEQPDGPTALFLLDEILQGTNSAERLIAVRRIIRKLLGHSAIGAVTSHELTVPDVPELSGAADVVHFRESAAQTPDGVTVAFDYKLRPGQSTSTNALKLMKMVGLD